MKKITLSILLFLLNNKNNETIKTEKELNLLAQKQDITCKIQNLKEQIITENKNKETTIGQIKNEIENLNKELESINLQIISAEIDLLNFVFNKELNSFKERNDTFENEIQSLKNTQNIISREIEEKQNKLNTILEKKQSLQNNNKC